MDFVFWIIVIVLIAGVVWWLLNRGSSARNSGAGGKDQAGYSAQGDAIRAEGALAGGSAAASADAAATAGTPGATGFGRPAEPVPPTIADDQPEVSAAAADLGMDPAAQPAGAGVGVPEGSPADGPVSLPVHADRAGQEAPRIEEDSTRQEGVRTQEDEAEWETQWSEASGSPAAPHAENPQTGGASATGGSSATGGQVHHPEYTGAHTPTLPGAETAAGENADEATDQDPAAMQTEAVTRTEVPARAAALPNVPDDAPEAETLDRTQSSAAVETAASHLEEPAAAGAAPGTATEPAGHLAANEPYGQGSASPGPDGSGPADYTVKGDAGSMVYYEEGHPDYEQTRAEVWFESAAHAEAAGFRAPRRSRL